MTTDCYVSQPLLSALAITDPYPWNHHVECVLRATWGPELPEVRGHAEAMWRVARASGSRVRQSAMEVVRGRTLALQANWYGATFRGRSNPDMPFEPSAAMLMPADNIDLFELEGRFVEDGDEPAATTDCDLVLHGANVLGQVEMRAGKSYRPLHEWAMGFRLLVIDVVDADRLLRKVATDLGRSYNDVLRTVYPSARAVFPNLVYTARGPIGRSSLRGALHPADQDMIRATLDRAAAGMTLTDAQRPLSLPELTYQTEE